MATKPYLIIHRRGDSDGQIAPFLEAHSPPTVPCHRTLVVMPRRARGDRRRGRSLCQLVGSEYQCLSLRFSLSSSLTRGLSHTPRGVRGIITSFLLTAWPRRPWGPIPPIYPGQGCVAKSWPYQYDPSLPMAYRRSPNCSIQPCRSTRSHHYPYFTYSVISLLTRQLDFDKLGISHRLCKI